MLLCGSALQGCSRDSFQDFLKKGIPNRTDTEEARRMVDVKI